MQPAARSVYEGYRQRGERWAALSQAIDGYRAHNGIFNDRARRPLRPSARPTETCHVVTKP
jgi:hypothetical protein